MIEILDPITLAVSPAAVRLGHGWHYILDYSWMILKVQEYCLPGDKILEVGCGESGLSAHLEKMGFDVDTIDKNPTNVADIVGDFLDLELRAGDYDAVIWLSSIEHQQDQDDVKRCVDKSMDILSGGGVFLATFGVSSTTYYDHSTAGWLFTPPDAMRVFGVNAVKGIYVNIWSVYRSNKFGMRDRYVDRFDYWDKHSPKYIAAGVTRIKPE